MDDPNEPTVNQTEATTQDGAAIPEGSAAPPVSTPPSYTEEDIARIREEARQEAIAQYEQQYQPTYTQQPADPYAEVAELMYENPAEAIRRTVEIARQETLKQVAPAIARVNTRDVVSDLAGDLDPEARRYAEKVVQGMDPAAIPPPMREFIRNALENVDRKARETRAHREPPHAEPTVRVNQDAFAAFNADRAQYGLQPLSAAEYARLESEQ